jgi:hypothetical protein
MRKGLIVLVVLLFLLSILGSGFSSPFQILWEKIKELENEIEILQWRVSEDEELLFRQVEYTIYLQFELDKAGIEYEWYDSYMRNYLYPNGESFSDCVEERMEYEFERVASD